MSKSVRPSHFWDHKSEPELLRPPVKKRLWDSGIPGIPGIKCRPTDETLALRLFVEGASSVLMDPIGEEDVLAEHLLLVLHVDQSLPHPILPLVPSIGPSTAGRKLLVHSRLDGQL